MKRQAFLYILLIVACYAVSNAAPGDVTRSPGTAFTTMSGNGGKFKATNPKSAVYFTGSSVTINPLTNTVRISGGTGGTIDPAVLNGKHDKTAFTSYSIARQSQYSASQIILNGHVSNYSNPHNVTASQIGTINIDGGTW